MQLEIIIAALRSRCPTLGARIAGASQFKLLPETAALPVPCAFVIPLDDNPGENQSMNGIRQLLHDSFAVIVALDNRVDEKGQASAHTTDSLRAELWAALLGWQPTPRYDGVTYQGGQLLEIDRARLWYQFEFSAAMEIEGSDGWQQRELAGLGLYEGANVHVDFINPSTAAPDGHIEAGFSINNQTT